jgi:cellulose synthase/poly-beta-1,6-N-acetylglucosamine synthase-like glycosyltransferase
MDPSETVLSNVFHNCEYCLSCLVHLMALCSSDGFKYPEKSSRDCSFINILNYFKLKQHITQTSQSTLYTMYALLAFITLPWVIAHPRLFMAAAAAAPYFLQSTGRSLHDVRAEIASRVAGILPESLRRHDVLNDQMTVVFLHLFVFRYLRLIVHLISFWLFYRPTPVPPNPTLFPSDCTIILPTVDPENRDFEECITSCLENGPGAIIIVTVGAELTKLTKSIVEPYSRRYPLTQISVKTADEANKRRQVAHGLRYVKTKITVLLDDHVFWPTERFLPTLLAPFEDPKVGIVGTNNRVRRTDTGFNIRSFWNMIGALYLERHNFEIRATNAIDGGTFVVSGRTSAHRSEILKDPAFIEEFTNERFFFGLFGPLNADDDNCITRWDVRHGWKIKIQYCPDAMIETTLGTYPKFLSQCLRWVRTTWRSNSASLFTDRTVWYTQPWCVYAVYWTSFVNFALFYDGALAYTLLKSPLGTAANLKYLAAWIFCTKMVKLTPYFLREPQDLVMLPGYFVFAYFHSLIKLYAGLTFWETNWGGRNLAAINNQAGGGPDDDDADDSSDDSVNGGVQLPPTPPSSRRRKTAGSSSSGSGAEDGSNTGRTINRAATASGSKRATSTAGTKAPRKAQAQPMSRVSSSSASSTSSSTSSRWQRCPGCRKLHSDSGSVDGRGGCQVQSPGWGQ